MIIKIKLLKTGMMVALTLTSILYVGCDGGSGGEIVVSERATFSGTDIPVTLKAGDKIAISVGADSSFTINILSSEMLEITNSRGEVFIDPTRFIRTRVGSSVFFSIFDALPGFGYTTGGLDGVEAGVVALNGEATAIAAGVNFRDTPSEMTSDALFDEGALLGLALLVDEDTSQIGIFESFNYILPDSGIGIRNSSTLRGLDVIDPGSFSLNGVIIENDFDSPIDGTITRSLVP
jgi:hypothetical protein